MTAVDVVVPCYNYARYLRGCVESVLSQRDVDVRVLIIDDKSSDNTPDIGQELAASDPRITFRRHEVNKGLIGTANEGVIEWAKAPYTLLLSADDAITAGSLSRATSVMEQNSTVGMVFGRAIVLYDDDAPSHYDDPQSLNAKIIPGSDFLRHVCEQGNDVPSPTAVVRTERLHQLGGYHPNFPHTSDMEMWMRIATCSDIGVIKEMQGYYRRHRSNMTLQYIANRVGDRRKRLETAVHVYKENNGGRIPGFSKALANMKRALSEEALWAASVASENGKTADAKECLEFAYEFHPKLRLSKAALFLRLKSLLGPEKTRILRRVFKLASRTDEQSVIDRWLGSHGICGWWPEDDEVAFPEKRADNELTFDAADFYAATANRIAARR